MIHGDVLSERARLSPDKEALVVVATGERFTYRQLAERARTAALVWRSLLGLDAGDRIAVLAGNRVELVDAFFAAARSGVVVVPLNTRSTARELAWVMEDSGARALVYDGAFADTVAALRDLVPIETVVALDEPADGDTSMASLVERVGTSSDDETLLRRSAPDDLYCLLYTSGTTGRPKGVMIPHRMVGWNAVGTVVSWQLREDDVSPIFTPLYHAGGLGAFLSPIMAVGGTVVLHAAFDAAEVLATIERERCTVVLGVPTIWKMLAEAPEFAGTDLSRVRWFISGGAPLPVYLVEAYRRRGVVLRQGYGLTEVGVNCFAMSDEDALRKKGSIGRPMLFTEARVVDGENRPLPPGEVGELVFRGPHVSAGYWRNPEATRQALDDDGWFHTGDLARVDEDGFFTIAGRQKDMLISGGVNVYPAEIEGELLQHPAVQDAAVVGVPDERWGERGVAFVVLRPERSVDPDELAAFLGERLARYKIPREFVFRDALPRTPYGKVVKGELRDAWVAGHGGAS